MKYIRGIAKESESNAIIPDSPCLYAIDIQSNDSEKRAGRRDGSLA